MKIKNLLKGALTVSLFTAALAFAEEPIKVGVVDIESCFEKSYLGQQEHAKVEALRNEMISMFETKQKEFRDVAEKLNNPDYMDTLTAEAEKELEQKARALSDELQLLENQSTQALHQAQAKMSQNFKTEIDKACEYIAREKDLDYIVTTHSCFYYKKPADMTPLVISEMNRHYQPEKDSKQVK